MSIDTSQLANGVTGTTVATGVVGSGLSLTSIISEYALVITVSCTFFGVIIALVFHIINSRINRKRLNIQRADKVSQWISEGKTIDDIEKILAITDGIYKKR